MQTFSDFIMGMHDQEFRQNWQSTFGGMEKPQVIHWIQSMPSAERNRWAKTMGYTGQVDDGYFSMSGREYPPQGQYNPNEQGDYYRQSRLSPNSHQKLQTSGASAYPNTSLSESNDSHYGQEGPLYSYPMNVTLDESGDQGIDNRRPAGKMATSSSPAMEYANGMAPNKLKMIADMMQSTQGGIPAPPKPGNSWDTNNRGQRDMYNRQRNNYKASGPFESNQSYGVNQDVSEQMFRESGGDTLSGDATQQRELERNKMATEWLRSKMG